MASNVTPTWTIHNARVFDGIRVREWTSLRLQDGLIAACDRTPLPVQGELVDAAGGWVLPGFIDAHTHLLPGALRQAMTFGVTTELDMFCEPELVRRSKAEAASDLSVADVRSAGIGATAPGGHPTMMFGSIPTLTDAAEAQQFVADRLAEGSDYLKVICESGTSGPWAMPALPAEAVVALTAAGHSHGVPVVAHVTSAAAMELAIDAGVDVLAHVPVDAALSADLVTRLADSGVTVCPTLATIENALGAPGGPELAADPLIATVLGPRWARRLSGSASGWRAQDMPPYARARETTTQLVEAGVPLLAGTDAPNPGTAHGASLHRELELLVAAGLSPVAALVAATSAPAARFGLTDRGRIAPGMRADLVLVGGDPTLDIRVTRDLRGVWRGGHRADRSVFVGSAAEEEELAALDAQVERVLAAVRARWPGAVPPPS